MGGLSKHNLGQTLAKAFRLSSWKLLLVLVLLGFLAATFLRFDHIKMTELREAVMTADKADNDEEIAKALNELHSFVLKHIIFNAVEDNGVQTITFGTGPFYLENQYLRKANEAIAAAQKEINSHSTNPNGNIYKKVSSICDAQGRKYGYSYPDKRYLNCWINELAAYPVEDSMDAYGAATLPSTELFRYEFVSPLWYPCASGITLLICAIILIVLVLRLFVWLILRIMLMVVNHSVKK